MEGGTGGFFEEHFMHLHRAWLTSAVIMIAVIGTIALMMLPAFVVPKVRLPMKVWEEVRQKALRYALIILASPPEKEALQEVRRLESMGMTLDEAIAEVAVKKGLWGEFGPDSDPRVSPWIGKTAEGRICMLDVFGKPYKFAWDGEKITLLVPGVSLKNQRKLNTTAPHNLK